MVVDFRTPSPEETKKTLRRLLVAALDAQASLSADKIMADTLTLRVTLDQLVAVANDYLKRR